MLCCCTQACTWAGAWSLAWSPRLNCTAARSTWLQLRENVLTGKHMLLGKPLVKLWLYYLGLGKESAGFQINQSLSQSFTPSPLRSGPFSQARFPAPHGRHLGSYWACAQRSTFSFRFIPPRLQPRLMTSNQFFLPALAIRPGGQRVRRFPGEAVNVTASY